MHLFSEGVGLKLLWLAPKGNRSPIMLSTLPPPSLQALGCPTLPTRRILFHSHTNAYEAPRAYRISHCYTKRVYNFMQTLSTK